MKTQPIKTKGHQSVHAAVIFEHDCFRMPRASPVSQYWHDWHEIMAEKNYRNRFGPMFETLGSYIATIGGKPILAMQSVDKVWFVHPHSAKVHRQNVLPTAECICSMIVAQVTDGRDRPGMVLHNHTILVLARGDLG